MTITLHHPNSNNNSAGNVNNEDLIGGLDNANRPVFVSGDQSWLDTVIKAVFRNLTLSPTGSQPPTTEGQQVNESWNQVPDQTARDVCDAFSFPYMDLTQSDPVRQAFVVIYVLVIVLSLFGNWMVIWTVIRNKHMRTVTNYYIVNLAVSDFLVAVFVMPLKLLEYTAPCAWDIFNGDAMCSFMSFVLPVFVFASVLTLVAISMERYYAIVYPLSAMKVHSKSRTRKILACTWIIPIIVASPYLFYKSYPFVIFSDLGSISRQICTDRFDEIDMALYGPEARDSGRFRKGFFFFLFIAIYLVPLLVILGTCVRIAMRLLKPLVEKQESVQGQRITRKREENKRRVARMIVVVAVAFIAAWSPFYMVTFISQVQTTSFLRKSNYIFVMLAVHLVGFINSCINPFIYNFMSDKFRKSFAQIVLSLCCLCARMPLCRRYFVKRSRAFSHRSSEYDPEYSMGDFNRAQPTQHSPLGNDSDTRRQMSRSRYDSSDSPADTTIIRLTRLDGGNGASGDRVTSTSPFNLPNGTGCGHEITQLGIVSPSAHVGGGKVNVSQRDEQQKEGMVGVGRRFKASVETAAGSGRQHLDMEISDMYDRPTSNLLRHSQDQL